MSEYMERHSVARLIGSPPGYVGYDEGGQMTEAVRRRPYRVLLLDEIEKAHPDVINVLLQLLDAGRLTDSAGRTVDFKNTVIIMTSNIGARVIHGEREMGFRNASDVSPASTRQMESIKSRIMDDLKRAFRPEFLNRIDDVIIFHSLSHEDIKQIVDLLLKTTEKQLKQRDLRLEVTEAARDFIANSGFDPVYGARPLKRTIQRMVENPISSGILRREFRDGDTVVVDTDGEKIVARLKVPAGSQSTIEKTEPEKTGVAV